MSEQDPVGRPPEEVEPQETAPTTESLSIEDLENIVSAEPEAVLEEDELAVEAQEEVEEQEEAPVEAAAEEAEEAQEEAPADTEEDTPDDSQLRMEEMDLSMKLLEKHLGRSTGNEGFLKQRLARLEQENAQLKAGQQQPQVHEDYEQSPDVPPPAPVAERTAQDPALAYVVRQAAQEGGNLFVSEVSGGRPVAELPEIEQKAIVEVLNAAKSDQRLAEIQQMGDPEYARASTRDLLTAEYYSLRRSQIRELRKKYADNNAANLKRRKRSASVTQSNAPTPRPKRRGPTDLKKASLEDLQKLGGIY